MAKGNVTGKGGFGENPQNINRNGAPKGSGLNLTSLLKAKLEEVPEGKKEAYKDLFIKTLLHSALIDKDLQSLKLIINYVDGLPRQAIDMNLSDGRELQTKLDKLIDDINDGLPKN